MSKKSIYLTLSVILVLIVASITIVFSVSPVVNADVNQGLLLNKASYFEINGDGVLHGLSTNGERMVEQYSRYSVEIPSNVTYIDHNAFSNDIRLVSVTIPSSVEFIGNSAFEGCSKLSQCIIPNNSSITTIGSRAFYNCTSLN